MMTTVYDKIEKWAIERNLIDGSTSQAQFVKLAEELGEVAECISKGKPTGELEKEIGDMIVVLTIWYLFDIKPPLVFVNYPIDGRVAICNCIEAQTRRLA